LCESCVDFVLIVCCRPRRLFWSNQKCSSGMLLGRTLNFVAYTVILRLNRFLLLLFCLLSQLEENWEGEETRERWKPLLEIHWTWIQDSQGSRRRYLFFIPLEE